MIKLPIEKATIESGTTSVSAAMGSTGPLLGLAGAIRRAEEDAAIDAEDILMQAEEANALDPVG